MTMERISSNFDFQSNYIEVMSSKLHYIEQGAGTPILFLHGMPASSYIWRNVIPHLSKLGRCIAVDLIGMGKSDKPDIEYSITDHINYIEKFIELMGLKRIILVMHGWGSIIGFHYAMHHESNCLGLVAYEPYLRPIQDEDFSLPFQEQLSLLQQQEVNHDIIMNGTAFIDHVMPQGMMRTLSEDEMNHYKEPFIQQGTGRPLHQYLKELPRGNGSSKADDIITQYHKQLMQSKLPKLLLYSIPGFTTTIATVMWAKDNISNIEIAEVGESLHFAQESNPVLMGATMSIWMQAIEQMA